MVYHKTRWSRESTRGTITEASMRKENHTNRVKSEIHLTSHAFGVTNLAITQQIVPIGCFNCRKLLSRKKVTLKKRMS